MKHELDEQLKAQWEAAKVEDFEMSFDTEALWGKINKDSSNERPAKRLVLPMLKYAAALAIGAGLSWFYFDSNTAKPPIMATETEFAEKQDGPIVEEKMPPTILGQSNQEIVASKVEKRYNKQPKVIPFAKEATSKHAFIAAIDSNRVAPMPQMDIKDVNIAMAPQKKMKTMHIADLENADVIYQERSNSVINMLAQKTEQATDDIAISTKIIKKLY